jgi:ArsR family transcriptional regulator
MSKKKVTGSGNLSPEALEKVAQTFRVLGEPVRLQRLQELRKGECSVSELTTTTGLAQASVSKHLKTMHDTGFLTRRKEGVKVFYLLTDELVFSLCRLVCGKLAEEQKDRSDIDYMI